MPRLDTHNARKHSDRNKKAIQQAMTASREDQRHQEDERVPGESNFVSSGGDDDGLLDELVRESLDSVVKVAAQQAEQVVDRLESYSKPPDKPVDEPAKEVKPCRNKNCDKPVKRGFLYCGKCLPLARKRAAKRAKEDPKNVYVAPRICEIKDRHIFTPVSDMSPSNFDRYDEESDAQIYGPKEKAKRR